MEIYCLQSCETHRRPKAAYCAIIKVYSRFFDRCSIPDEAHPLTSVRDNLGNRKVFIVILDVFLTGILFMIRKIFYDVVEETTAMSPSPLKFN